MGQSREDGVMDAFDEVVEFLYGGAVDPREMRDLIAKMGPDASSVHAPGTGKSGKKKFMNTVGIGLNGLAMGAGTHALVMAGRDERLQDAAKTDKAKGKMSFARIASKPYRAYAKTGMHTALEGKMGRGTKLATAAAGGALALHGAELVGDSIAMNALHGQRKQNSNQDVHVIKKAFDDIADARKSGAISTEQAIELADDLMTRIEKFNVLAPITSSKKAMISLKAVTTPSGRRASKQAKALSTYSGNILVSSYPKARKAALTTTAVAAGGGGIYTGKKMQQSKQEKGQYVTNPFGKSITWEGEISKVNDEKRQVFGWCSVSEVDGEPVLDHQGDYVPIEEMEKSAYEYVIKSRKGGDMHSRVKKDWKLDEPLHVSDMIESFVVTPEKLAQMGLEPNALPAAWWVGFKVNDDNVWDMVKNGERLAFSIHGSGKRTEKVL